jgi:protease I
MAPDLNGQTIAFLVADEGVEEIEMTEPWTAVEKAGGKPELVSPEGGTVQAFNHLDKSKTYAADHGLEDADPARYDGLVLPGGVANPDMLRTDPRAVQFVKAFFTDERPVAVICHGPWTLVEAGVVKDRTITSWPSLQTDIRNAGGTWVDETVHVDRMLVSSRKPDDLPEFCKQMLEQFAAHGSRTAHTGSRSDG